MAGNLILHKTAFDNYFNGLEGKNSKLITAADLDQVRSYLEGLENGVKVEVDHNLKRRIISNGFFLLSLSDEATSKTKRAVYTTVKNKEKVRV